MEGTPYEFTKEKKFSSIDEVKHTKIIVKANVMSFILTNKW